MPTDSQARYIESLLGRLGYSEQFALSECFGVSIEGQRAIPASARTITALTVGDASVLIDWLKQEEAPDA